MKKLSCHCGEVLGEVQLPKDGLKIKRRCNCTLCKRKGTVMTFVEVKDLQIKNGSDKLTKYQYHTKVAEHYFCKICGIYTHHKMRSNPNMYGVNTACIEGIDVYKLDNIEIFDGINHPLDQKK
tara:strand:- start:28 stop:396 length:369 start_codon:yes stop_codon:yes gene_type:complete